MEHPVPWLMINLDRREYFETLMPRNDRGSDVRIVDPLWSLTIVPTVPAPCTKMLGTSKYAPSHGTKTGLLDLPTEIIHKIFGEIDRVQDAICFSLVNKVYANLGVPYIHNLLTLEAASWHGDRIAWVTYKTPLLFETEDPKGRKLFWPEGVFTCAERKELLQFHADNRGRYLDEFVKAKFKLIETHGRALVDVIELPTRMNMVERDVYYDWGFPKYVGEQYVVLKNLSRRQYVKGCDLAAWTQELQMPMELLAVLANRLCWYSRGLEFDKGPRLQLWAGDRIELSAWEPNSLKPEDGWTDILAELKAEWKEKRGDPRRPIETEIVE
ncbi:hypothetical protein NM688_g5884 [Phlebia brevispora]|uniref:Uncharacterized protein n=1 Tax=Phlebia brevispora TaxID=194682 RepID=A0ACC1SNF8_9APHY|nr:hypothetical protein NM688_g5884 [Phlebia brevispora]